jgi:hypothetical protein
VSHVFNTCAALDILCDTSDKVSDSLYSTVLPPSGWYSVAIVTSSTIIRLACVIILLEAGAVLAIVWGTQVLHI